MNEEEFIIEKIKEYNSEKRILCEKVEMVITSYYCDKISENGTKCNCVYRKCEFIEPLGLDNLFVEVKEKTI